MTDEIPKEPLMYKLQLKMYEHDLDDVKMDVIPLLYDYLKIFIRSVIRKMVRMKKKYDIICPLLKPTAKDDENKYITERGETNKDFIRRKVLFNKDPFTVKDLFECFKAFPHIIPRRNIYQVNLLRISQVMNDEKPKRTKFTETEI